MKKKPRSHSILIKKQFGQHFLRDQNIADFIVNTADLDKQSSVFEIGCGDGFLTKTILQTNIKQLWVFEIDHEWAQFIKKEIQDERLTVFEQNFLDVDFSQFEPYKPWTLLSNLPYNVTFPILKLLKKHRDILREGIIMVQEEVAQKLLKTKGRGYGYISLYFQHYFSWKKLIKVPPQAFYPPPKVTSRLLYFKPKKDLITIPNEKEFWIFVKCCFRQPRRTLKNNLVQTHYDIDQISQETLLLRAQQMSMNDFLQIWKTLSTD